MTESNETTKPNKKDVPLMVITEARSDGDYHQAYPILRQLLPHLDMQTYARRVFVARATGYRMYIGRVGEEVVGLIGIIPNHNLHDGFVTYIEHVVVDRKYRGFGYGGQLIKFAEDRAIEDGCALIELDTDLGREDVEGLYAKSGYHVTGKYHQKALDKFRDTYTANEQR